MVKGFSHAVTLGGWGQHAASLADSFPGARALDYRLLGLEETFAALRAQAPEVLIGWSLGGQLAVRACAEGGVRPKLLVLLGAPYRFVRSATVPEGSPPDRFRSFRQGFTEDGEVALARFLPIISRNDRHEARVLETLRSYPLQAEGWASWLDRLEHYSCEQVDFSALPPLLVAHGAGDDVVRFAQGRRFHASAPGSRFLALEGCGHAPHLHDRERLTAAIKEAYGAFL